MASVYVRLMVSPKALAACAKRLTITWRASSVCARKTQSSAESRSRMSSSQQTSDPYI